MIAVAISLGMGVGTSWQVQVQAHRTSNQPSLRGSEYPRWPTPSSPHFYLFGPRLAMDRNELLNYS